MATSFIKRKYIEAITGNICDFEDVLQHNISVILGEPASGKTYQLKEYQKLNSQNSLCIELLDIENENEITKNIEIVLLDSIDEALSKNDGDKSLKNKLSRYIKNCKQINSNIKIVITCRYVEWKEIFEEELKSIDKEMQIFYIEELSKEEVNILLEEKEIAKIEFWQFIEVNYLEELLKNIMMVIHLVDNFEIYKGKTLKYFEIYQKIIEQHIDVKTDNERNVKLETIPLDESIKIASVIATYMTLNRKREVSIEEINILAHKLYKLDGIVITGEKLNIIFDTALFSGTRIKMRFFHKSIQEYLTAYFINIKKFDVDTIKSIFAHKDGFYEEFEEVIIYLTNIEENFFKHFIEFDPIIFRRHPYLSQEEQIKLVTTMLQTLKTDGQKVWSKREYIEDSSLVRLNLKDKLIEIVRENIDTTSVGRELFSYLQSLLDHNYSKELEDVLFEILDNIKNDKKLCLDFMRINHIENLNYNKRLFDFILSHDLIIKEQDYLYIEIFKVLYTHRNFNDLIVLLENFSDYHDKKQLEKIKIDDIVFWLKKIIQNYDKKIKSYSEAQISFLIFLVLKNYGILEDKAMLKTIFEFIQNREIYDLDFYIGDYEKDRYKFYFKDIKDEFWRFFFLQGERDVYYLLNVFKYCEIFIEDIKEISVIYSIENYKDHYIYFMRLIQDIDIFLMKNIAFKTYMEDIWSKQKEREKKWVQRDRPYLKKREQEEKNIQLNYEKAISSLSTNSDLINIYRTAKHYSVKKITIKETLAKDLKEKYAIFIELSKKAFQDDELYFNVKQTMSHYYISDVYDFLFSHISEDEILHLVSDDKEYEKLFWHIVSSYNLSKQYFICTSKIYTSKLVELSKELLQTHLFDGSLIHLFKEINIYDTKNLESLIEAIKEIDIKYFLDLNVQKEYLLDILSLDADNYKYLMSLFNLKKSNTAYFKFLLQIDINRAMRDYIKTFALNNDVNLTFSPVGNFDMLKPNYKYNQFDILTICPHIRKYYKSLLDLLHSLAEYRDFSILKNLNDENIRFILEKYFILFKEYHHPTVTYSPDIYDNMNDTISFLLKILGEDTSKIPLLEILKDSLHVRGQASIRWQLKNAYNQQLKDRAYSKKIIDSFEIREGNDRFFDYEKFKSDLLYISLVLMESRKSIYNENEDLINDRYRDALKIKGYDVLDQSRAGESQSGKSVGERDLVIRHNQTGIVESVIEAFILESCDVSVIYNHYTKLIGKYDTNGNEQNFILVYSKAQDFEKLWEKYKICFTNFEEELSGKVNLKVGYIRVNNVKIYHLFINFYSVNN